jgi:hypothetical protein
MKTEARKASQPASRVVTIPSLDSRGRLALLAAGKHKPGGLALAVDRVRSLGRSVGSILEDVGERVVLAVAARGDAANALDALAGLLTRAGSVRANGTPAATCRSPGAAALQLANQAA